MSAALPELPRSIRAIDDAAERNLAALERATGHSLRAAEPVTQPTTPEIGDAVSVALAALPEDPGAVFEPAVLSALRQIRVADKARWARIRNTVKGAKSVSLVEFDRLTEAAATSSQPDDTGMFPEVTPWTDRVDGSALLTEIVGTIRRFVIADQPAIHAAALWAVHTWLIDVLTVSPIGNIHAPEMRCGKTVMLTVLGKLSYRPMQVANIAPAALFRSIEAWRPTLLIDEVDTFLREHEEARGIINSGFTRDSAFVVRCVGDDHTPTKFLTWGAKALCGIGKIADTLADRAIPIRLRRKLAGEHVENVRHADPSQWIELQARIARWTDDHRHRIAVARPSPIKGLNDRANDCWEPLLSIADQAGGDWPRAARLAAAILHGLDADAPTIGVQLLADIREAFGHRDRMTTADLLTALVADDETPWPTWNRGRPMTARQLSGRLSEFGVRSNTIRIGSHTAKGYILEQFKDAFDRYLSADTPVSSVTPSQVNGGAGSQPLSSVTGPSDVTDEKARKAHAGGGCDVVTDKTPLAAEWEVEL